jgi:hypothetical protein
MITTSPQPASPAPADADIAAALQALTQRVDALAELLEPLRPAVGLLQQGPALAATLGDSFDDVMRQIGDSGIDVEHGLLNGAAAALRFGAFMDAAKVHEIEALLQSGVLDPAALQAMGELGRALSETATTTAHPVGPLALLGALRQPDVQRALGFLVIFAERFGRRLRDQPGLRQLPVRP